MALTRFLAPLLTKASCQEDWKDLCALTNPCIFMIYCKRTNSHCGGFFINSSGYGLTAYHFYTACNERLDDCTLHYNNSIYKLELISKNKASHTLLVRGKGIKHNKFLRLTTQPLPLGSEVALFSVNSNGVPIFEPGYLLEHKYSKVTEVDFACFRSSCRGGPGYSGGPLVGRDGLVISMQKSCSNLFSVFDSVSVPSCEILRFLKGLGKETAKGWEFN